MTISNRNELLEVLRELSEQCPEMLGQLIVNLATIAKGPVVEAIWDAEDEELLAAARQQLEVFLVKRSQAFESAN